MEQNALIIGLGWHSREIMEAIAAQFTDQRLAALWLPPVADTAPNIKGDLNEVFPLTLKAEQLEELYFHQDLKKWCAPNWYDWNENIIGTRLWGQLAMTVNYHDLYTRLRSLIDKLSRTPAPVNIYIIAHAHDPFASGALIDLAYMVGQKLPPNIEYRTYGIVLLPEMEADPLLPDENDNRRSHLQQALAYSLLRELNFYESAPSFYSNYQVLDTIDRINDISPFQNGDCYLLGAKSNLVYSDVVQAIARFCYLQTATPLGKEITTSPLSSGLFSSFGIVHESNPVRQALTDGAEQQSALMKRVLNHLLAEGARTPPRSELIVHLMNNPLRLQTDDGSLDGQLNLERLPTYERYKRDLEQFRSRAAASDALESLESTYLTMRQEMSRMEREVQLGVAERLETLPRQIREALSQLQDEVDSYLRPLYDSHRAEYRLVDTRWREVHTSLPGLEQKASRFARNIQRTRMQYQYNTERRTSPIPFLTGLGLTGIGAAFLFIASEVSGWEILWLLLATVLLWFFFRRQRVQAVEQSYAQYVNSIMDFLDVQRQLVVERALYHYLTVMRETLHEMLAKGTDFEKPDYRILPKIEALATLQDSLRTTPETLQRVAEIEIENDIQGIFSAVLDLDMPNLPVTDPFIKQQFRNLIEPRLNHLLRYSRPDHELLMAVVPQMQARAEALLSFTRLADSQAPRQVIGLSNWDLAIDTSLSGLGWRLVHLEEKQGEVRNSTVDFLQVFNQVAPSMLGNIDSWRERYNFLVQDFQTGYDPERYSHRAFFHPRRVGLASPAIVQDVAKNAENTTHLGMLMSLFIHWLAPQHIVEKLCAQLNVRLEDDSLDELCGALQEAPQQLLNIRHEAQRAFEEAGGRETEQLQAIRDLIMKRMAFMERNYADWQVWAAQTLLEDIDERFNANTSMYSASYLTVIAQLYYYYNVHSRREISA